MKKKPQRKPPDMTHRKFWYAAVRDWKPARSNEDYWITWVETDSPEQSPHERVPTPGTRCRGFRGHFIIRDTILIMRFRQTEWLVAQRGTLE